MNRLEWILAGLIALLIVAVATMGLLFWGEQQQLPERAVSSSDSAATDGSAAEAAPAETESRRTAQSTYRQAEVVAREWADDAELITARASWAAGQPFDLEANWGFLFYSKAQSATALISVAEEQPQLVRTNKTDKALDPLTVSAWLIDSPAVLEQVMSNGGQEFVENNSKASLTLTLDALKQFQWEARFIDVENQEVLTMQIDPVSGNVSAPSLPEAEE